MDCHRGTTAVSLYLVIAISLIVPVTVEANESPSNSTSRTVNHIVISLEKFQLLAKHDGKLVKAYPIATGMDTGPTPKGSFEVINKLKNPWYTPDDEPAQKPGPDNPLGTRWIGIDKPSYGIHGTKNPNSIGTRASEGCIRMFNSHVEELFQMVEPGTKVTIRDSLEQSDRNLVRRTLTSENSEGS